MDNSVALLKEFTQFKISDEDAQKYLKWSKGNVETALNYYYTKQDKQ